MGLLVAVAVGGALWLGPPEARAWLPAVVGEEPVLLLLVDGRAGVALVRGAVDPARVLVSTPDALVLAEGRVVATSPEAAGGPLTRAGWAERGIEIWRAAPAHRAGPPPGRARAGSEAGERTGPSLAELRHKPTLTTAEAMAALRLMGN